MRDIERYKRAAQILLMMSRLCTLYFNLHGSIVTHLSPPGLYSFGINKSDSVHSNCCMIYWNNANTANVAPELALWVYLRSREFFFAGLTFKTFLRHLSIARRYKRTVRALLSGVDENV